MLVLTEEIAGGIAGKLATLTGCTLLITNHEGVLVYSEEAGQVGTTWPLALRAFASGEEAAEGGEGGEVFQLAVPLRMNENYVGALGLVGVAGEARRVAPVACVAVEALLEKLVLEKRHLPKRRLLENWAISLFNEEVTDLNELTEVAKNLHVDIGATCQVFVINFFDEKNRLNSNVYRELAFDENYIMLIVGGFMTVNFSAYLGKGLYAVCVETDPAKDYHRRETTNLDVMLQQLHNVLKNMRLQYHIGVGARGTGLQGYLESYRQALQSVRMIQKLGGEMPIMHIYDWHVFNFIAQIPEEAVRSLVRQYLNGKPAFEGKIIDTMEAYFQNNCGVQQTSDTAYMHKNTLLYRLQKVKDVYGLDPRDFRDAVILQLLIYTRKMYPKLFE